MDRIPRKQADLNYDERSAGGIVYKIVDGHIYWFVIKTLSKKKTLYHGKKIRHTIYKFPKGHLDSGEVLKQAAIREVEEECRIKAKIIDKIGSKDYIIWDEVANKKIIKKVTFFLMEYLSESNLKYYDSEAVIGREWHRLEDALKKLAYDFERNLLKKANTHLLSLLKTKK